jgi:MFS transporter, MHS family, proline/betaine transporter
VVDTPAKRSSQHMASRAVAVAIGNFMEWFDFAVYGFFAIVIGRQFFASDSPVVEVLSALAVFAVGFFMRPLGGFILGPIGDRFGRRTALSISVVGMGLATGLIGFIPSYAAIGVLAPLLLVVLRCVQGLSAGGEWTGSASFLIESGSSKHRGLLASIISGTAALATLVGSLFALLLNSVLTPEELGAWGWRIPFWCAIPLAAVGLFMRLRLSETPVFEKMRENRTDEGNHLRRALKTSRLLILLTVAFAAVEGLGYYYLGTYVTNYLQVSVKLEPAMALALAGIGIFLYLCMTPIAGALSDRFGRRPLNLIGTVGFAVLTIPIFLMMRTGSAALIIIALALFGACLALTNVTTTVMVVELFPASTRMSGASIGFNLALAFIAGPGPYIGAWLAATFDSAVAPAYYMVAVAIAAAIVLIPWLPESLHRDLHDEDAGWYHKPPNTPGRLTSPSLQQAGGV